MCFFFIFILFGVFFQVSFIVCIRKCYFSVVYFIKRYFNVSQVNGCILFGMIYFCYLGWCIDSFGYQYIDFVLQVVFDNFIFLVCLVGYQVGVFSNRVIFDSSFNLIQLLKVYLISLWVVEMLLNDWVWVGIKLQIQQFCFVYIKAECFGFFFYQCFFYEVVLQLVVVVVQVIIRVVI